ncbi:MAG: poly(A) polymerase, partial [Nocardioidaceae bacterium]|nr:poly(A) polymerase [Nocardioidaceae bacterium]
MSDQRTLSQVQRSALRELVRATPVIGEVGRRFQEAGHEIALVGGPVRDLLMSRLSSDLDFATSARPDDIEGCLAGWVDASWDVGRDFGTIGAMVGGWTLEITTYRADAYDAASRKPEVSYGDDLEGDLARRDFAVNAMAVVLPDLRFVDPFGGMDDLLGRLLRTPGTPAQSFGDDPLRMLRAARFAAQLQFSVSPDVVDAMRDMADRLEIVSAER